MGLQPSVTSVSGGTRNWNSTGESRDSKTTKIIEFHSNLGGVTTRSYNSTVEKRNGKTFLKKTFEFNSLRCRETILEYVRSTVGPRKDHKKKNDSSTKKKNDSNSRHLGVSEMKLDATKYCTAFLRPLVLYSCKAWVTTSSALFRSSLQYLRNETWG